MDNQPTNASPVALQVITGKVIDKDDRIGIPQASVTVVNQGGTYMGDGVATGNEGFFLLDSPLLAGNLLQISSVGYNSVFVDPAQMAYYTEIELTKDYEALEEVIVTPGQNKKSLLPWVAAAAAAALLLYKRKKRR